MPPRPAAFALAMLTASPALAGTAPGPVVTLELASRLYARALAQDENAFYKVTVINRASAEGQYLLATN